jgi:hypothetical protein
MMRMTNTNIPRKQPTINPRRRVTSECRMPLLESEFISMMLLRA